MNSHGQTAGIKSWSRLQSTASIGSTTIVLQDNVGWSVGDEIGNVFINKSI